MPESLGQRDRLAMSLVISIIQDTSSVAQQFGPSQCALFVSKLGPAPTPLEGVAWQQTEHRGLSGQARAPAAGVSVESKLHNLMGEAAFDDSKHYFPQGSTIRKPS